MNARLYTALSSLFLMVPAHSLAGGLLLYETATDNVGLANAGAAARAQGPATLASTLEFRGAITGVAASTEGLKPYEVVPVALVFAGAMAAAGERDQNSELYLDGEFIDTATGKTVMRVVRKGMGKTLSNDKQAVTFADLQAVIDDLTTDVLKFH